MPDLQVSYCLWAPDHKTDAAAQKRLTLQNEHSAYFEALRAKGAICESPSPIHAHKSQTMLTPCSLPSIRRRDHDGGRAASAHGSPRLRGLGGCV